MFEAAIVLLAAAGLDYLLGDPWGWLHPVQVMGWYIDRWSRATWRYCARPWMQRWSGVGLALTLVLGCGGGSWAVIAVLGRWQPWLGLALQTILLASCLAARSLRCAALEVLAATAPELDLPLARARLSRYVGRDTDRLSLPEIYRALLETVAENAVDGATAPWFYALVGAGLGIGPVPLALAYKAASTLDSMVGYPRTPYTHLGWASAKLDDWLTWIPCRLTVFTLGLLAGKLPWVWRICRRDGSRDPSPNSGWSEAAYAAILGVQLGGENYYQGELRAKPLIGEAQRLIDRLVILTALGWTRKVILVWGAIGLAFLRVKLTGVGLIFVIV